MLPAALLISDASLLLALQAWDLSQCRWSAPPPVVSFLLGVLAGRNGAASPALCGRVAYYAQSWKCIFRLSVSFDSFDCTPAAVNTLTREFASVAEGGF